MADNNLLKEILGNALGNILKALGNTRTSGRSLKARKIGMVGWPGWKGSSDHH